MGNIDFFRKEVVNNFKYHIYREVAPRALSFIKDEVNIFLDQKINTIRKTQNDNTVKPQHFTRKSKNPNTAQRAG